MANKRATYKVLCYLPDGTLHATYDHMHQAIEQSGLAYWQIRNAIQWGHEYPYRGFVWRQEGQLFEEPFWMYKKRMKATTN